MTIRPATISDVPFIALVVVEALGDDIMERYPEHIGGQDRRRLELLADSIRTDNTLYSWRHTSIAQDTDGTPLGAIVAYPADNYMQMRTSTFVMLSDLISFDVESMDAEAHPGEYYVDSIAVVPHARGKVSLYKAKECIEKNIPEEEAVERLLKFIEEDLKQQ